MITYHTINSMTREATLKDLQGIENIDYICSIDEGMALTDILLYVRYEGYTDVYNKETREKITSYNNEISNAI